MSALNVAELNQKSPPRPAQRLADELTVFGQVERHCVEIIDRVADQMLMPRSWVVAQILKEWIERRLGLESRPLGGESWDDSFKEILGRAGLTEEHLAERQRVA